MLPKITGPLKRVLDGTTEKGVPTTELSRYLYAVRTAAPFTIREVDGFLGKLDKDGKSNGYWTLFEAARGGQGERELVDGSTKDTPPMIPSRQVLERVALLFGPHAGVTREDLLVACGYGTAKQLTQADLVRLKREHETGHRVAEVVTETVTEILTEVSVPAWREIAIEMRTLIDDIARNPVKGNVPVTAWTPTLAAQFLIQRTGDPWTLHKLGSLANTLGWRRGTNWVDEIHCIDTLVGTPGQPAHHAVVYTAQALQHILNDPQTAWTAASDKRTPV